MEDLNKTITLLKDKEWSVIDGAFCRVIHFTPFASIDNGKIQKHDFAMPYCSLEIECKILPRKADGFITHKIDFSNLWKAFKERGVNENEEVIIIWTTRNYKNGLTKLISSVMPKIIVMIYHKFAFEVITDRNLGGLTGEALANAISPVEKYKPDIMN